MSENIPHHQKLLSVSVTLLKYLLTAVLVIVVSPTRSILLSGLLQIAAIFLATDFLLQYSGYFQILNFAAMLIVNTEYAVMYFANSFISLTMLQNLASLADLSGKAAQYIIGVILVIIVSALPVKQIIRGKGIKPAIVKTAGAMIAQAVVIFQFGNVSAVGSIVKIYNDYIAYQETMDKIDNTDTDYRGPDSEFYKAEIGDYTGKPESLADEPNIILVFTEGLSSNIIYDERNIMPNLAALSKESLSFQGYFNHTFATYHALQGQLFSGFQFNNWDKNNLISIHKLLQQNNYTACFINTEPLNADFSAYLDDMQFDEVVSSDLLTNVAGMQYTSDKVAYELLFSKALEMNAEESPFILSMYSFGTHVSLDSPDEIFGEGNDPLLNKFYNLDCQIGAFLEQFRNSELFDNTMIIFTADHATYQDQDFSNAFPDFPRPVTVVDEMPLFIYYKDIVPQTVDVKGKTTLNLVPTILDYLDVTGENYFLGDSLFNTANQDKNLYMSWNAEYAVSTVNAEIAWVTGTDLEEFNEFLQDYFVICRYEETEAAETSDEQENQDN